MEYNPEIVAYSNGGKSDKVERFGWTIADSQGQFRLIPKGDLQIDKTYQRDQILSRIRNIQRNWSWVALGVITVADRNGVLYIIDGCHRVMAARNRSDIGSLPCMVFATVEVREEAKGFIGANTVRKPITSYERFKAQVISDDPIAVRVAALFDDFNRKNLNSDSGEAVRCTGVMMRLMREDENLTRRIFPLANTLCDGIAINSRILEALAYIEARMPDGESLSNKRWSQRLRDVGRDKINAEISKAATYFVTGGAKVWATGLLRAINSGLKKYRLEITGLSAATD